MLSRLWHFLLTYPEKIVSISIERSKWLLYIDLLFTAVSNTHRLNNRSMEVYIRSMVIPTVIIEYLVQPRVPVYV